MSESNIEKTDQPSTEDISTEAVVAEKNQSTQKIEQSAQGQVQDVKESKEEEKQEKVQEKETEKIVKDEGEKEENTSGKKKKNKKKQQTLTITAKELKMMSKKIEQLDVVKEQYEKMRKNYQLLRSDRDQYKSNYEQVSTSQQNTEKQLEKIKAQLYKVQEQREQLRKEQQTLNKKIQQYKRVEGNKKDLEERIKQLENIIDMTTSNLELTKKSTEKIQAETDKYKELLRIEKDSNNNIRNQLEKLRLVQSETFVMKQELVRIGAQYKNLKAEKEQMPIMIDKFQHQEHMIKELKDTIKEIEAKYQQTKSINEKMEKKLATLIEEKKDFEKKIKKLRIELEETNGQVDALKMELDDDRNEWEIQKKRYTTEIRSLKTELHKQHEKLTITEWQLNESKKKEKKPVQIERVNVMDLSKEDMLNLLEQMEMKNQAMKITLENTADTIHQKDKKLKQQESAIMALAREITKDYPNYQESQGMDYVEKDIIAIGRQKKDDWGEIVEKVMVENLRLKYSVTALGEQYNQKLRKQFQK